MRSSVVAAVVEIGVAIEIGVEIEIGIAMEIAIVAIAETLDRFLVPATTCEAKYHLDYQVN